jgi:hypothetical protein
VEPIPTLLESGPSSHREPEVAAVKLPSAAGLVLALTLSAFTRAALAQTPEPTEPTTPPATPAPPAEKPKTPMQDRWFFGGGVGAAFGSVDYLEIAPLVGFRVVPRVDLGLQPFYRWTNDSRYSPSLETSDYGARLFARFRVVYNFFLEADYQFTSYEYPNGFGGSTRASNNAFLAGAGYSMPVGRNVGLYFSALYDFTYNNDDPYYPYDSPVQFQFGVAVGF